MEAGVFTIRRRSLSGGALKQRPQAVPDYAVENEGGACVRRLAKKQLAASVAVGIDRVDQFDAGQDIEMLSVGDAGECPVQFSVDIVAGHDGDDVLQVGSWGIG